MALVNGSDYDHVDLHPVSGGDVTRHMLKDAQARQNVSDLTSALNTAEDSIYIKQADTTLWESGSINGSNGTDASNGMRIRTKTFLNQDILAFTVLDGYSVLVYGFDGDTYIGTYYDGNWVKSTSPSQLKYYEGTFRMAELPTLYAYRLVVKNTSGTSMSVSDAANILFWTSADKAQDAKISSIETGLTNAVAKFGNYSSLISADATSISGTEENPADFDRLLDPGDYKVTSVSAARHVHNMPDKVAGRLLVMQTSQAAKILQVYVANNAAKATIYTRLYDNGTWTAWYNVSPAYDETPTAGSTRPVTSGGIYAALQNVSTSEIVYIPSHLSPLGTALTYRIPQKLFAGETYINDTTVTDGIAANITQGICSDGVRYLYYNLAPMGENLGREVNQRIRKWDTWTNTSAGLSAPGDWGHCEDTCFVPAWCPGFDNGNVDRLYTTDFNYSVGTPAGYYIHVINANTLEYITSFRTDTLVNSEYWVGAMHLVFNQERGLFCLKCGSTVGDYKYWCFAVFDASGTLLRAARVRYVGTGIGFDCDENYIYPVRYSSAGIYGYVIDWNLNPIARFSLDKADWEIEGVCHIGSDVYISYNQEKISGQERKNTIVKTKPIYDYYDATGTPIATWPTNDGVHRTEWTMIEV